MWDKYKEIVSRDIILRVEQESCNFKVNINPDILNETLIVIENEPLKIIGKRLTDFGMISPTRTDDDNSDNLTVISYNIDELSPFVQSNEHKLVYNTVLNNISRNSGQLFLLFAPGITGKKFVVNLLFLKPRMQQKISLAVVSSRIAAKLSKTGNTAFDI